jgi:hypothetical protein
MIVGIAAESGALRLLQGNRQTEGSQRRFHRVPRRRPVVVYSHGGEDTACSFVRLESVGRGGALLLCDQPVPIGAEVDLAICLAGAVIRTRARVVYHRDEDGDGVGIGVEFLELSGDNAVLLEQLIAREDEAETVPVDPGAAPA